MNVRELRESLAKLPGDFEVVISLGESAFGSTQHAYRVDETSLEWFQRKSDDVGLIYYLDGTDIANAFCLRVTS